MTEQTAIDTEISGDSECPFCHGRGIDPFSEKMAAIQELCDMCGGRGSLVIISNIFEGDEK